jgi:Zn-dependent membrane protease YugP
LIYILPALVLALLAQFHVRSTFARYSGVLCARGITGAEAARQILDRNGLYHVRVEPVEGRLSDHYDPRAQAVRLSKDVYDGRSVASVGVAAHECGHAVQHSVGYGPLRLRNAIIPVTQFSSSVSIWLVLIGFVFSFSALVLAGVLFFSLAVLFQLITLPVEYNASARAVETLGREKILTGAELAGARKVLGAAALTYVAATVVAFANLLRLVSLYTGMRRRD